jgi:prepilin-type N-terminal cleavage/methylation domain-containing protein
MVRKNGFTFVEILITMTIVSVLAISMAGIFNALRPVNKGRDVQRKKDLNRIKEAFEEYYNDKGSYPTDIDSWNVKSNCKSDSVFKPYLTSWPCDPNGVPYRIIIGNNTFRILVNLENKDDKDIPKNWYDRNDFVMLGLTKNDVNFGVSSSNIKWYDPINNN